MASGASHILSGQHLIGIVEEVSQRWRNARRGAGAGIAQTHASVGAQKAALVGHSPFQANAGVGHPASVVQGYSSQLAMMNMAVDLPSSCVELANNIGQLLGASAANAELRNAASKLAHECGLAARRAQHERQTRQQLSQNILQKGLLGVICDEPFSWSKPPSWRTPFDPGQDEPIIKVIEALEAGANRRWSRAAGATLTGSFQLSADALALVAIFVANLVPAAYFSRAFGNIVRILRADVGPSRCHERLAAATALMNGGHGPLYRLGWAEREYWSTTLEAVQMDNGLRGIGAVAACASGVGVLVGGAGCILAAIGAFVASGAEWGVLRRHMSMCTGSTPQSTLVHRVPLQALMATEEGIAGLTAYAGVERTMLQAAQGNASVFEVLQQLVPMLKRP